MPLDTTFRHSTSMSYQLFGDISGRLNQIAATIFFMKLLTTGHTHLIAMILSVMRRQFVLFSVSKTEVEIAILAFGLGVCALSKNFNSAI